jgi:DNA-binding transcriptional LysR family regulator
MVGAGLGVAVVPRLTVDFNDRTTVPLALDGIVPPRRIGLVSHTDRYRSPAARGLADIARDICAQFAGERATAVSA